MDSHKSQIPHNAWEITPNHPNAVGEKVREGDTVSIRWALIPSNQIGMAEGYAGRGVLPINQVGTPLDYIIVQLPVVAGGSYYGQSMKLRMESSDMQVFLART